MVVIAGGGVDVYSSTRYVGVVSLILERAVKEVFCLSASQSIKDPSARYSTVASLGKSRKGYTPGVRGVPETTATVCNHAISCLVRKRILRGDAECLSDDLCAHCRPLSSVHERVPLPGHGAVGTFLSQPLPLVSSDCSPGVHLQHGKRESRHCDKSTSANRQGKSFISSLVFFVFF